MTNDHSVRSPSTDGESTSNTVRAGMREAWPDPTPEMLNGNPLFEAIWQAIKTWDVNVPAAYGGYCGATGNHARAIYDAIAALQLPETGEIPFADSAGLKSRTAQSEQGGCGDDLAPQGATASINSEANSPAAPVEWHDIEEDDPDVILVAHAIAEHGVGRPWDDFLPVNAYDMDHGDLTEYARAAVAALRAKYAAETDAVAPENVGGTETSFLVANSRQGEPGANASKGVTAGETATFTSDPYSIISNTVFGSAPTIPGDIKEALEDCREYFTGKRRPELMMGMGHPHQPKLITKIDRALAAISALPVESVQRHTPTSDPDVAEALTQACEYFENLADVTDGDYGVPEPNREMRLAQMCSDALDGLPQPSTTETAGGEG